jgi:hypothetical protein
MFAIKYVAAIGLAVLSSGIISKPAEANINCWYKAADDGGSVRVAKIADDCTEAQFLLVPGEGTRNIRETPNGKIVGKLTDQSCNHSAFNSYSVITLDNGRTYWAYGTTGGTCDGGRGITGFLEVGNRAAVTYSRFRGQNHHLPRF